MVSLETPACVKESYIQCTPIERCQPVENSQLRESASVMLLESVSLTLSRFMAPWASQYSSSGLAETGIL